MANFNSDNLAPAPTTVYDANYKAPGPISHARERIKFMKTVVPINSASDTITLGRFKPADRLNTIQLSTATATPTTGAVNLGLYVAGLENIPLAANIIDVDLFAAAVDLTVAQADLDVMTQATTVLAYHRGLTLWEMANLGAASYTEDPMEDWLLVASFTTALDAEASTSFVSEFVSFG